MLNVMLVSGLSKLVEQLQHLDVFRNTPGTANCLPLVLNPRFTMPTSFARFSVVMNPGIHVAKRVSHATMIPADCLHLMLHVIVESV